MSGYAPVVGARLRQDTYHVIRDHKPTLGGPDPSMPDDDDQGRHLRRVFAASPRGFPFYDIPRRIR